MLGSSGNCLGAAGVGRRVEWGSAQLSLPLETRVGLPILIHLNFLFGSFEPVEKTLDCASKIVEKVGTLREKLLWAFLNTFEKQNTDHCFKNDRPGDDGTLRSVQLLVFLLGVIDLASASAKRLLV